jgi:hypothetical protein
VTRAYHNSTHNRDTHARQNTCSFLLAEFAQWIRKEHHKNLKGMWPPTQEQGKQTNSNKNAQAKDAKPGNKAASQANDDHGDEFVSGTDSGSDDE